MGDGTRKGKIARLPADVRREVNQRLYDGQTGSQIIPWLHSLSTVLKVLDQHFGEEPITPQNLSEWRTGGYRDWLDELERVERLKSVSEYAVKLAKADGGNITDGAAAIAGGRILQMFEAADQENVLELAVALAKLRESEAKQRTSRVNEAKLGQKDRELDLIELKFQRDTAKLFLKWWDDRRAREIAESKDKSEIKMDKLVQLLFGDRPEGIQ